MQQNKQIHLTYRIVSKGCFRTSCLSGTKCPSVFFADSSMFGWHHPQSSSNVQQLSSPRVILSQNGLTATANDICKRISNVTANREFLFFWSFLCRCSFEPKHFFLVQINAKSAYVWNLKQKVHADVLLSVTPVCIFSQFCVSNKFPTATA